MANITMTSRGTTVFVKGLKGGDFSPGFMLSFSDTDGAQFMLTPDAVASIISIVSHVMKGPRGKDLSIEKLVRELKGGK